MRPRRAKATLFDKMTADDIKSFLNTCGVDDMAEFVEQAVVPFIGKLEAATATLRSLGLKLFDDLIGRETDRLVELLSAAVALRERDFFTDRGGGWLMGS